MFDFLLITYILGAVFFGGLCAITLWKTGGFQGFADLFNSLGAGLISSNYVQWMVAIMTFGWFIFIPFMLITIAIASRLTPDE